MTATATKPELKSGKKKSCRKEAVDDRNSQKQLCFGMGFRLPVRLNVLLVCFAGLVEGTISNKANC